MVHAIIIGCRGFVGRHLCRAFPTSLSLDRSQLDLLNPQLTFSTDGYRYAFVAAGIGSPKLCEEDPERSYRCNVVGTLALGKELLKRGILPIFFSTDYVFDNALRIEPLNEYGRQKAELEREGSKLGALVIRLSKVYGIEKGDGTLFDEMATGLVQGRGVRAAYDQVFAPVFVGDLMERIRELLELDVRGVVEVFGPHFAPRFEMAQMMADKLKVERGLITKISLEDLKDGVLRPKFLKVRGSERNLSWEEGIDLVAQKYV